MFDTHVAYEKLAAVLDPRAAQTVVEILTGLTAAEDRTYLESKFGGMEARGDRHDGLIASLAEAQALTERRLATLTERVDQLAVSMDQLTKRVDKLGERMDQLTVRMDQLTERVDKLGERMDQLTERVDRLTDKVDRLADNVSDLTDTVRRIDRRIDDTNKQWGGLAATMGLQLNVRALAQLPKLLERDHGVIVEEALDTGWVLTRDFEDVEADIFGRGRRHSTGETVFILGEVKMQLSRKEVERFLKTRVTQVDSDGLAVVPVIVCGTESQSGALEAARGKGVSAYRAIDLERV